ncbi:SP_1767 family glycosyltransferase [Limosilactobacillus reuteri]|uniref:SP_1767 family glycosyltransferase n=2 Tax=Lactobacillaceae TaxID=33958 RepID=UPI001E4510C1|nr:SP_1767 family glycosyltransferase [Limosilactobacillus reuteri]MCC4413374.1 SP_1767 family glycosyltransferase [Limosilactobacillus reuteri]
MKTIVLCANYDKLDQIETVLKSIYINNNDVKTYIINSDIAHEWFVNINYFLEKINSEIIDAKIDLNRFNELPELKNANMAKIEYGKFLIPELISEDKVLYLSNNTIIDQNLDSLFAIDIEDKPLYATVDFVHPDKFNMDVMFINNIYWRNNNIGNQFLELGKHYDLVDAQAMINDGFRVNIGKLPAIYNYQIGIGDPNFEPVISYRYYEDAIDDPAIIQYPTSSRLIRENSSKNLSKKWWSYHSSEWSEVITHLIPNRLDKKFDKEAIIFLNYAENHGAEELIKRLPNIHFNIVSRVELYSGLDILTHNGNVTLYPQMLHYQLKSIIEKADLCFDIDYGDKDVHFETVLKMLDIPTFAFSDTQYHETNANYYVTDSMDEMIKQVNKLPANSPKKSFDDIFDISVKPIDETLDEILENNKSIIRIGDGELDLIYGKDIGYQHFNPQLAKILKDSILSNHNPRILTCLSDIFTNLDRYNEIRGYYAFGVLPEYSEFFRKIEEKKYSYGSAFMSRMYMCFKDKSKSQHYFHKLRKIWQDKDILIVEGEYTRSGVGNDLFANARSIQRIICPAEDAYDEVDEIEEAIRNEAQNKLILLMLGPTAKVIVNDLQDLNNQMLDVGHIDTEYEWFKMGAKYPVPIGKNKHTAEAAYEYLGEENDPQYQKEIIMKINKKEKP